MIARLKNASCAAALLSLIALGYTTNAAAQATATIVGTIKDVQGAVIPGAAVTLTSETRGTTFSGKTTSTGDFIFPNIPGDTYTLSVSTSGFKRADRKGIFATDGDRVAVPVVTLEVGNINESVEVTAEAPLIQTATGERSATIEQHAIQNIPVSGTFFAQMVALTPGVNSTSSNGPTRSDNTGNVARTNYMLDGVTSVNTGGNQPGISLNMDSIAEVKVLTNSYQAEYGRSSGLQVIGITKSGTDHFHGSLYDFEQHSGWNSNSWANSLNGVARPYSRIRNWGGTIGGPVGKPGHQNKLFWFVSEQVQPTTTGGNVNYFRVPTALERQGNFSQTTDNNGKLFNTITDPQANATCSATSMAGCFSSGGVLGVIPQSRLYPLGQAILSHYPVANVSGLNYNLQTVAPRVTQTNFQSVIRGDWNASSNLRISGKYAGQNAIVVPVAGSIPGFNDRVTQFPALLVPSVTVVYTFTPTLIFEGTIGYTRGNQLGSEPISPAANRCNSPELCAFPFLFPNAQNVTKGSYQEKVLIGENAPYFKDGQMLLQPNYTWGSRIANAPPNNNYPPFVNWQYTVDSNLAMTKIWGTHTFKGGFSSQTSMKVQNLGTQTLGVLPVEGALNFGQNSNNPLDSGFGYSNAALGIFQSYAQQSALVEGRYVYHNNDFYIQDNWKLTRKLTLDMGLRFVHNGPQYDSRGQLSNFFPDKWQADQAPLLFTPGCAVSANPCPSASRVAINPQTGSSLGLGSSSIIGNIVPNTGNLLNGIIRAGQGINKANYSEPALIYGPRFGAAYAFSDKIVFRGGIGLFYDRPQGDAIYGQVGNPPTGQAATVYNSTLQSVAGGSATAYQAPPQLVVYNYNAAVPASFQFNFGTQVVLPWAGLVDVSYIQTKNYNTVAWGTIGTPGGYSPLDLNAPDLGAAYLPKNQDPTLGTSSVPGATALTTNLLRPYRGLGAIYDTWPRYNDLYSAIQASYRRQYRNGISGGFNYTLGLRNTGNMLTQPILTHTSSGAVSFSPVYSQNENVINNVGFRRHTLKGFLVYELPKAHNLPKIAAAAVNGWQVSVVYTGGSGAPYDVTYNYASNGSAVNLTGSPQYLGRIKVGSNPGSGCGTQYAQVNASAFSGPTYNSVGNESGSSLFNYCFLNITDIAVNRSFRLFSEQRRFSFRLDAFNVFNTTVISAASTTMQLANPTAGSTITNNQFTADGTLNSARLTPLTAGFGAATGAMPRRTLQAQIRFTF
ncbi:MAG: carboxypeptidase regulatory-like domain-containing protein [Terriglobia bacterium]